MTPGTWRTLRWCADSSSVGRPSVSRCPSPSDQQLNPSGWIRWAVWGMRRPCGSAPQQSGDRRTVDTSRT
ncbi:hypothetical protein JZ751_028542 [Albula glossodonta]|uniref:Uncharacterized protein n=1 Tax=Albula glossodonta TaxID=121402 RepID=A0A8T2MQU7_9TELE|nr:hypothetical protein JZ751_028542 [Albula glossodonta]